MKNIVIIVFLLLVLLISSCSSFSLPETMSVEELEKAIDDANYCEQDSDCMQVTAKCPIKCYMLINKEEEKFMMGLVNTYTHTCMYKCEMSQDFACINKKCRYLA